jgi:hypothetical protein
LILQISADGQSTSYRIAQLTRQTLRLKPL